MISPWQRLDNWTLSQLPECGLFDLAHQMPVFVVRQSVQRLFCQTADVREIWAIENPSPLEPIAVRQNGVFEERVCWINWQTEMIPHATENCPIIPASSCSKMWQWYMKGAFLLAA